MQLLHEHRLVVPADLALLLRVLLRLQGLGRGVQTEVRVTELVEPYLHQIMAMRFDPRPSPAQSDAPSAAGTTSSRACPMTCGPSSNRSEPAASASTSASTTSTTPSTGWSTASSPPPRSWPARSSSPAEQHRWSARCPSLDSSPPASVWPRGSGSSHAASRTTRGSPGHARPSTSLGADDTPRRKRTSCHDDHRSLGVPDPMCRASFDARGRRGVT